MMGPADNDDSSEKPCSFSQEKEICTESVHGVALLHPGHNLHFSLGKCVHILHF